MTTLFFDNGTLFWAVLIDCAVGDPRFLPHPVQGLGFLANCLERILRRLVALLKLPAGAEASALRLAGLAGVLLLTGFSAALVYFALELAQLLGGSALYFFAALYFSWSGLAMGSLLREGRASLKLLRKLDEPDCAAEDLYKARRSVGMLVSRDTKDMGPEELRRSLAESLSENFCDAFMAPFFWLCVAGPAYGPVALWAYKSVSTLDSMWGYKNEKWRDFGWAAARADDILAYIPARLSAFILWLGALGHFHGSWPGWKRIAGEAGSMESPNSGWSMSVVAWLMQTRMGGPTPYDGKVKLKPVLGPEGPEFNGDWDCGKLDEVLKLLLTGACWACALVLIARCIYIVSV